MGVRGIAMIDLFHLPMFLTLTFIEIGGEARTIIHNRGNQQ